MMTTKRIKLTLLAVIFAAAPVFGAVNTSDDAQKDRAERDHDRKEAREERESDLYDEGTDALDEKDWMRAAKAFRKVAQMQMEHADAALYWLARSQNESLALNCSFRGWLTAEVTVPKVAASMLVPGVPKWTALLTLNASA